MQEIAAGSATETMTAADLARRLDEEERIADLKAVALKNAEALKKTKAAALQKAKAHALKKEEAKRRAAKTKAKNKTAANAPNADSATDYTLRLSRLEAQSKVQLHRLNNIQNIIVPSVIETETTTTKSGRIYSVNDVRNKNHKNHKKASKKKIIRNATGSKQVILNKNKVILNKHDSWTCYLCDVNYSWKNLKPHYYTHYPNCKDPAIMNTFLNKIRNNSILKNKITITPSKKSNKSNVSPALTLKLSRLEAKNRVQLHRLNKIHCILDPSVIETKDSTKLSTKVSTEPLNLKPKKKKRKNQKKKLVQVATKEKKNNVFNFVCTNATKDGCTTNSLMGAPANLFKKMLKEINKETHILLYNISTKCVYVGYTPATGVAKMNIDPLVWPSNSKGKKSSKFPAQLRCECVHGDKKLIQIKLKDSDILPMFKRVGPVPYNIYEKLIERHTLHKTKVTTTGESKQNETKKKSKKKTKKNKEIQEKIQENNQIDNLICSVCELELSLKDIRCPACDYLIEPTSLSEMRTKRKARSLKEEQLLRPSKNDLDTIKCIEKYLKGRNYTALLHSILSDLKKKHSKMYKTFMLEHNEDLHQFLSKKFCFLTAATFAKIKKKNSLLRRNCVHAYWDKLQKKNQFLLKSDPRSLCLKSVVFEDQKREMQQKADALLVKKKKHEQANRNTRNIAKNATKSNQVNHKVSEPIKMTMGQKVRARRAREEMYARANTPVDSVQQEEHLRRATNLEKTNHNMAARQMAARRQGAIQSQNSRIYEFNNATPGMSGMSERSSNLNPNTNIFKPSQEIRKNCNHNPCLTPHYCMHNMTNSRNSRNSMNTMNSRNSMNSMNTMNSRNIRNNNTNLNAAHTILKVVQKKQNNTTAHEYTGLPTLDKLAHLSHHPDHQQYLQQMEFLSSRQKLNEQKKQLQQIKEKRAQLKQQRQTQLQQQRQTKAQVQAVAKAQAKAHATEQAHAQAQALADRRKKRMLLLKRQQDEELKRIEKRKKEAQQKAKEEEIKRQAEESMILQRLASEKEKRERMTSKQRAKNDMEEKRIEMYRSKLEKERQMKKEQKRINTIKEIEENQYNQEMERIRQQHLYQQNAIKAYEKKYVLKLLQRCITGWYNRAMNKEVRKLRLKTKSEKKRMNEKISKQKKLKEEKLKNAKEKGKNNLMLNQKKKQALKLSEIYHMDVSSTETKTTVESIYEKREKYWKHSREKEEKHILLLREMCVWEFIEMENTTNATNGNSVIMNQVEQRTLRNELRQGRAYTRLFNASRHGYLRAIKKTRKGIYMECDENGNPGNPGNSGNPSNPGNTGNKNSKNYAKDGKGGKESTKMTKMEVVLKGYDDINNVYIVCKSNKNNENNAEDNTDIYVESKYLIQPSNSQSLDSQISFIYVDVDTLLNDMDFNIKIDVSDFKIYMGVEPDDYVNGFPRWDKCLLGWINVRKSKIMEQELILNQKLQLEQAQIEYDLKHPTVEKIYTEDEKLLKTMEQNAKSIQKENDAQRRKERMQREAAALLASASEETRRKAARKKKERARHKKQIKRGNRMRKEEEERLKYLYRHINYMYGMHFFDDDNSDEDEYGDGDEYEEHRHFHRDQNERHHEAQLRRQKDQQSATVLGIDVNANANEIKESYRSLARKYHPDKWHVDLGISKEEGQEKFKEISNAYQHLNA